MSLISQIDKAIEGFNKSIPAVEREIFDELILLTKDLDLRSGRIVQSAKNVKIIGQIKRKLEKIIITPDYASSLDDFTEAFKTVQNLQNKSFSTLVKDFSPPRALNAIRIEAVNSTMELLSKQGLQNELTTPVRDILTTNITARVKFTDLTGKLSNHLLNKVA